MSRVFSRSASQLFGDIRSCGLVIEGSEVARKMAFYPLNMRAVRVPVFLSSTFLDLLQHRNEIRQHLTELGWPELKDMESVAPGPQKPLKECLKMVEESQIYLGLVAWRYGSVLKSPFSVTEREYNRAKCMHLYRVILFENKKKKKVRPDDPKNLFRFRKKVARECWVGWFQDHKTAALEAVTAICAQHSKMTCRMCIEVDCPYEDFFLQFGTYAKFLREAISDDCGIDPEYVWITSPAPWFAGRTALVVLLPHGAMERYLRVAPEKRKGGVVSAEPYDPPRSFANVFQRTLLHSPLLVKLASMSIDFVAFWSPPAALLLKGDQSPASKA